MKRLIDKISKKWSSYKFRFVPWVVFNMTERTAKSSSIHEENSDIFLKEKIIKDIKSIYKDLHLRHQCVLRKVAGFNLSVAPSSVSGAGQGVFIDHGYAKRGSVVGLYPGTVYQPYQPILLQSIANKFIFRCVDGVLIDGNHTYLSAAIFRSCVGRDQVGMCKVGDTSWLLGTSVNPLNVGQIVNNENTENQANVHYQELDIPLEFPLPLRKFWGNINFESSAVDGVRPLRVVVLIALRDIREGEELFSSYFTVIR